LSASAVCVAGPPGARRALVLRWVLHSCNEGHIRDALAADCFLCVFGVVQTEMPHRIPLGHYPVIDLRRVNDSERQERHGRDVARIETTKEDGRWLSSGRSEKSEMVREIPQFRTTPLPRAFSSSLVWLFTAITTQLSTKIAPSTPSGFHSTSFTSPIPAPIFVIALLIPRPKFYSPSILIYQAINGYTELAFEHVWLFSHPIPVRREFEVCFLGCKNPRYRKAELAG